MSLSALDIAELTGDCRPENTVIFLFGNFANAAMAFAFTTAQPFQKPLYTNVLFLSAFIISWVLSSVIALSPIGRLAELLQLLTTMPWSYRQDSIFLSCFSHLGVDGVSAFLVGSALRLRCSGSACSLRGLGAC